MTNDQKPKRPDIEDTRDLADDPPVGCIGIAFDRVIELCDYIETLEGTIFSLKRGSCWCDMGIGDPRLKDHTSICYEVQRLVEGMK